MDGRIYIHLLTCVVLLTRCGFDIQRLRELAKLSITEYDVTFVLFRMSTTLAVTVSTSLNDNRMLKRISKLKHRACYKYRKMDIQMILPNAKCLLQEPNANKKYNEIVSKC